jgi:DNA mismatch repair protein MutS
MRHPFHDPTAADPEFGPDEQTQASQAAATHSANRSPDSASPQSSTAARNQQSSPPAPFESILFPTARAAVGTNFREDARVFGDLNIDQIVDRITVGSKEYDLASYFFTALTDPDAIAYRQEVMKDLEVPAIAEMTSRFSERMRATRSYLKLAETLDYKYERERWFLAAADIYCEGVRELAVELEHLDLKSRGLRGFRTFILPYTTSASFNELSTDITRLVAALESVKYNLLIKGNGITVFAFGDEPDYATEVEGIFERFTRAAVRDYRVNFQVAGRLNHVEAQILDRVARLYPEVFTALNSFFTAHAGFQDEVIRRFDREIQFYRSYLAFVARLRGAGLSFCYPQLSGIKDGIFCRGGFDLALAAKRVSEHERVPVVPNDFSLHGNERIFVVTGPNHGGKTTFARMFGQLHFFAALGCPVPGAEAKLVLFDRLFSHFGRAEDVRDLRGKLQDDLLRIREILDRATPQSIIILNEIFESTTARDAAYLGNEIMSNINRLDLLAVWVTFLDELAMSSAKTVSVVGAIDRHDPSIRTFKFERRAPDGLAYAHAIAEKHRVTYDWLKKRIAR